MEFKKDFILREVEKMTLFVNRLIIKVQGGEMSEIDIKIIDNDLKGMLNLGLFELLNEDDIKLKMNLSKLDKPILEKVLKLLFELYNKESELINKDKMKKRVIFLIAYINERTGIYSFERRLIKQKVNV